MKRIDLKMLIIQQWAADKRLDVRKIGTEVNASDMFTKPMRALKLTRFARDVGLCGGVFDTAEYDA